MCNIFDACWPYADDDDDSAAEAGGATRAMEAATAWLQLLNTTTNPTP
jgi:hypothetical protein